MVLSSGILNTSKANTQTKGKNIMGLLTPTCFCCGSELTAPTMIDGKIYGYTCAAKIKGGKQARKFKLIPAEIVKNLLADNGYRFAVIVSTPEGNKKVFIDSRTNEPAFSKVVDGQLFIRVKR